MLLRKSIFLVFLTVLLVLPKGAVHFAIHLPVIFHHFHHHQKQGHISFWEFIEHHEHNNHQHKNNSEHENLPFKHEHTLGGLQVVYPFISEECGITPRLISLATNQSDIQQLFFSSEFSTRVFQPPKVL